MKYTWYLSWQAWLSLLALGIALWTAISYASLIMEIVWILFGAFLLSLAIRPLADRLARRRVPRPLTVLGVYVSLIGLLAVLGALLAPIVTSETALLQSNGPNLLQTALSRLTSTPLLSRLIPFNDTLSQNLISDLYTLAPTFLNTVAGVGATLLNILVVLILAFFLASDTTIGPRLVQNLVPRRYQPQLLLVAGRLRDRLSRWIWAQLAVAFFFALTFGVGLAVLIDRVVGLGDGRAQSLRRRAPRLREAPADEIAGQAGGDLAGSVPAHPVDDDEDAALRIAEEAIFVARPLPPHVGGAVCFQR